MKTIKDICAFVGTVLFMLVMGVLVTTGISIGILWGIDMLCGTNFYTWENVGILTIAFIVFTRVRGGKN